MRVEAVTTTLGEFPMSFLKRDEVAQLQRELERWERDARFVNQRKRRQYITESIQQAWIELEQNNIRQAKSHLYEAQHHYALARIKNQVLFYKNVEAVGLSLVYLILFSLTLAFAVWYAPIRGDGVVFPILLSLSGGGIGGVTAVLSKVIGIRLETQASTSRMAWYIIKPLLGGIMGLVTYFAFLSGLSLLSGTLQIDNLSGVFLIGFLGGYLEGFSTRVLNELADRVAGAKEPEIPEDGSQFGEVNLSNNESDTEAAEPHNIVQDTPRSTPF